MAHYLKYLKQLGMPSRLATANWRTLPQFMIIGVQKGGTTSLYHYLNQHPQLSLSKPKEVHFFDDQYQKGMRFYRAHFPLKLKGKMSGEGSPYYFSHPGVKHRIKESLPQTKFIIVLRDPVKRAYSHYQMQVRAGVELLKSFDEALDAEEQRIAGEFEHMCNDYLYDSLSYKRFSYKERGFYHRHLALWLQEFPRGQFLILKSETLSAQPKSQLKKVYDFLGLEEIYPKQLKKKHVAQYSAISSATEKKLREAYQQDQYRLVSLLGPTFCWE